jgi:hypothetical protein
VLPAWRQRQRPASRRAEKAPVRIQQVQQREEVVLVRSAAVEEDEGPLEFALYRADAFD